MLADDRARRRHGGQLRLPNELQVMQAAGSWDRALALADLKPRSRTSHRPDRAPAGIIDVLDRCYEHYGVEPRFRDLETFAKANGIPFPRKQRGRPWSSYVEEWKAGRRARPTGSRRAAAEGPRARLHPGRRGRPARRTPQAQDLGRPVRARRLGRPLPARPAVRIQAE
jgi:hypothetical protein